MAPKRKRQGGESSHENSNSKRSKTSVVSETRDRTGHPVLLSYYENVLPLRQYILARFPDSSRSRKQRLKAVPSWIDKGTASNIIQQPEPTTAVTQEATTESPSPKSVDQVEISKLLDTTFVAYHDTRIYSNSGTATRVASLPRQSLLQLSQKLRSTVQSTSGENAPTQSEIVEFAVGHLLNNVYRASRYCPHILCNGISRSPVEQGYCRPWANGVYCTFPNCNAVVLQGSSWCSLLKLLGKDGDQVMIDLLLHCSIFVAVPSGKNNLCQISGVQLSEEPLLSKTNTSPNQLRTANPSRGKPTDISIKNRPQDIKIIRNRMFYARAGLNAKGMVKMGLQHIHVFNRCSNDNDQRQLVHVMKYIFPRQFGLHNVFTCRPDRRETVQSQQDYTMREQEIAISLRRKSIRRDADGVDKPHLPRRLRGHIVQIVQRILKRHKRCAYIELLRHYCYNKSFDQHLGDSNVLTDVEMGQKSSRTIPSQKNDIIAMATPSSNVFAFCRAVLLRLLPLDLLDSRGLDGPNLQLLLRLVEEFITARKRETLTLHLISQGFEISKIPWLEPPKVNQNQHLARSDLLKRTELFQELLYYIFDSILIPLIRSNFYVTESNTHIHRLFYFRHDIWRRLTEPCLNTLRETMFEETAKSKTSKHTSISDPYGHMRLVPKGSSFRPIMNLKRKPTIVLRGKMMLGTRSVNMLLKPVYSMLKHEKLRQPALLGSSMFSMDEIYPRLKAFSMHLIESKQNECPLYFAKVDVANCFDTIPQDKVFELMEQVCDQSAYGPVRHAEVSAKYIQSGTSPTIARKFRDREPARGLDDHRAFQEFITTNNAQQRNNTVFVEQSVPSMMDTKRLMKLLADHLSKNKVKMGRKFFSQKQGIPQGSILSSMLCNFFYGQFESEYLGFVNPQNSLLLRLLDDFLLVSLDMNTARRFLEVMHQGSTKYGIAVKRQKTMTNFPCIIDGHATAQCDGNAFPYCGKIINTVNLEIGKDRQRQVTGRISESLTVERGKSPGKAFYQLALDAMKRQLHAQYADATFISRPQVVQTLYQDFILSALRMHAYNQGLGQFGRAAPALILRTIQDLIEMTISILNSTSKLKEDVGYECRIGDLEVRWLATKAVRQIFQSKQSWYSHVLTWLEDQLVKHFSSNPKSITKLSKMVLAYRDGQGYVETWTQKCPGLCHFHP